MPASAGMLGAPQRVMLGLVEIDEAAYEEVESAVVVVVKPDRAGGPAGGGNAGLCGDVSKCAVAVVVVENAAAVLGHVEVRETVAVVVAHGDAHAVAAR